MIKKLLFTAIALCSGAFAHAGVVGGVDASTFVAPTVEHFAAGSVTQASYNFGNGMTFADLNGQSDLINYDGFYGLGDNGAATGGLDYDGYFGTANTPSTFEFKFNAGVKRFGFHGAEAVVSNGSLGRDGLIDLAFYDMNDVLMDTLSVDTYVLFSWDDFYGFESDAGAIGRVVFQGVGHMVLDDVTFEQAAAAVPEPGSIALFGLGLAGFAAARRKAARK